MLCRDTTYVSTLMLSMRTRTTFGAYHMSYVASPHNCWCVPLDLCRKGIAVLSTVSSPELLKTCVALRTTDALHTVYVAAYSITVYVVIHLMLQPCKLMSYCDITNVVRPQPYNLCRK